MVCSGFAGSRLRVGLLALPLCGAAVTFFAAAKKVTKETAFPIQSASCRPRHRRLAEWTGGSECPRRSNRAWIAHGLTRRAARVAGSARNSSGPLRGRTDNRVRVCFCVSLFSLVSLAYPTAARSAVPALFVLNQRAKGYGVSDRARSKPDQTYEGIGLVYGFSGHLRR